MPNLSATQQPDPRAEATDEALVVRYRRGERAAFSELVRRYLAPIHTFAWHHLGDDERANHVVVDTFREIVSRAAEFKHETRFANWAYGLTLTHAREQANRPDYQRPPLPSVAESDRTPAGAARRALAQLPQLQLEAVLLAEVGGLHLDDIADLLALDPPTVRTQLGYAIEFLRQAFSGTEEYVRALR